MANLLALVAHSGNTEIKWNKNMYSFLALSFHFMALMLASHKAFWHTFWFWGLVLNKDFNQAKG